MSRPKGEVEMIPYSLRLTPRQKALIESRGGAEWLRRILQKYVVKEDSNEKGS